MVYVADCAVETASIEPRAFRVIVLESVKIIQRVFEVPPVAAINVTPAAGYSPQIGRGPVDDAGSSAQSPSIPAAIATSERSDPKLPEGRQGGTQ